LDGIDALKISGEQFIEAAADGSKDSIDVPQTMVRGQQLDGRHVIRHREGSMWDCYVRGPC
jgi:hypothetical protein